MRLNISGYVRQSISVKAAISRQRAAQLSQDQFCDQSPRALLAGLVEGI